MKYTNDQIKKGDKIFVTRPSSDIPRNWNSKMDELVGQILTVSQVYKEYCEVEETGASCWRWYFIYDHFILLQDQTYELW